MTALLALLALYPRSPAAECVRARLPRLAAAADSAAREHGVPVALLVAVAWHESHLGCHPASGGCWGAPVSPQHRLTAGGAMHAARALATGRARCGTWEGAVRRFRGGACTGHDGYAARVLRTARGVGL